MNQHQILESYNDDDVISFNNEKGHLCRTSKLRETFTKTVII